LMSFILYLQQSYMYQVLLEFIMGSVDR